MIKLLRKEFTLSASPLTYIFLAFTLMSFIPNYPPLIGAFFVCLGIFYTFQKTREENDVVFTVLLPVKKTDAVTAKYLFCLINEVIALLLIAAFIPVKRVLCAAAPEVYTSALMSTNLTTLGFYALIFAAFNIFFLGGFFKTAYKIGKPFIIFCIVSFVLVFLGEALHHIPGLENLNDYSLFPSVIPCVIGLLVLAFGTLLSLNLAKKRFSAIDL
ncbi:MAG TPA: ABC transporter [Clostridiales bacterium]|nr:ABC transporter [Clostridiales bacterium]